MALMPDKILTEVPVRTLKTIDDEYMNYCAQIGDIQFKAERQIIALKVKIDALVEESKQMLAAGETRESVHKQDGTEKAP